MNDAGRIGFVIKGDYDNTSTYDFLDVVYYENTSYVAKKLTIGNEPEKNNEYWQILATSPNNTVIGVKGAAEADFHTGKVTITPENIGLCNVDNTSDSEKNVLSAKKLSVNANTGTATTPTYFKDGVPVPCSYSLEKSVPANAVFTDTTYNSLKNPNPITFSGNVTGNYDGSSSKTVHIPKYTKDVLFAGDAFQENGEIEIITDKTLNDYFIFEIHDSENRAYIVPNCDKALLIHNITNSSVNLRFMISRLYIYIPDKKFKFFIDGGLTLINYYDEQQININTNSDPTYGIKAIYGHKFL